MIVAFIAQAGCAGFNVSAAATNNSALIATRKTGLRELRRRAMHNLLVPVARILWPHKAKGKSERQNGDSIRGGAHLAQRLFTMTTMTDSERSLGTIVKELIADISTLFRSEIALLKFEFKELAAKLGGGAAMFAGALFLAIFGIGFLFVTLVLVLVALHVAAWLSTLIVTILLFAAAGILAFLGRKKFAAVEFMPTKSVEQIKSDIET